MWSTSWCSCHLPVAICLLLSNAKGLKMFLKLSGTRASPLLTINSVWIHLKDPYQLTDNTSVQKHWCLFFILGNCHKSNILLSCYFCESTNCNSWIILKLSSFEVQIKLWFCFVCFITFLYFYTHSDQAQTNRKNLLIITTIKVYL